MKLDREKTPTTKNVAAGIFSIVNCMSTIQLHTSRVATVKRIKSSNLTPAVSFLKAIRFIFGMKNKITGQSETRESSEAVWSAHRDTKSAILTTTKMTVCVCSSCACEGTLRGSRSVARFYRARTNAVNLVRESLSWIKP